jgi:cytochrome c-type biogenesis protein CcmH/NrfG
MSFWTAIVLIILIVFLAETLRPLAKGKKEKQRAAAHEEKIAALEERIANLESILLERERDQKFRDL